MTTYYVDPANGSNTNTGTSVTDAYATLDPLHYDGATPLQAGDVAQIRDTANVVQGQVQLYQIQGTSTNRIYIEAYENENPTLDLSAAAGSPGVFMNGTQFLTIDGIEITGAGDGIKVQSGGTQNADGIAIHNCNIHHNEANGIIVSSGTGSVKIHDCQLNNQSEMENGDGLRVTDGVASIDVRRCVAHSNADDGYDLIDVESTGDYLFVDCLARNNGLNGDGTGFKIGRYDLTVSNYETGGAELYRCAAHNQSGQLGAGYRISDGQSLTYNCTATDNLDYGFRMKGGTNPQIIKNCIAYQNTDGAIITSNTVTQEANTWNLGITNPEFISMDPASPDFLELQSYSPCIDVGVILNTTYETYSGDSPDLGAYESAKTDSGGGGTATQAFAYGLTAAGAFAHSNNIYTGTATSTALIESFEDGLSAYAGDTTAFDTKDEANIVPAASDGAFVLDFTPAATGTTYELSDTGDLKTFARGDAVSWDVYFPATDAQYPGLLFATQSEASPTESYLAQIDWDSTPDVGLFYQDSTGTFTKLGETTLPSRPTGEWLTVTIEWATDGTIVHSLTDSTGAELASVTAQDTTLASGGLGWYHVTNGSLTPADTPYVDNLRHVTPTGRVELDSFDSESFAGYNGETSEYSFNSIDALRGSALAGDSGGVSHIWTTSKRDFAKGEEAELYIYTPDIANSKEQSLDFGLVDGSNHYRARVSWRYDDIIIQVREAGTFTDIASATALGLTGSTWYVLRVRRHDATTGTDNHIVASVEATDGTELGAASVTDATYADATGWGFNNNHTASQPQVLNDEFYKTDL